MAAQPLASDRVARAYWLWVFAIVVLGLALRWDALFMGFVADDYAQLGMVQGTYLLERSPFNLFNFSDGSTEEGQILLRGGFYHWWTHPNLRLSMLRPLASAMIWLDWQLFGNFALGHHLHSLLWWLIFLGVVAHAFFRLLPPVAAGLAFALLVLDEAHGVALSWLANRSVFVTSAIVLATLLYYMRWRGAPNLRGGVIIAASLALALAFGEYALCGMCFLLSYELLAVRDKWSRRLVCLSPVLGPAVVFLVLRKVLGHEPQYSAVYVGLAEPREFARALIERLPVLYSDLLFALRAEYWTFGSPWTFEFFRHGWVSKAWLFSLEPWRHVHEGIGLLAMVLVGVLAFVAPSSGPYRHVRWLALGGAMATVPVVSSFPSSRLLMVALVGFTPLLASFAANALQGLHARKVLTPWRAWSVAAIAGALALYHVVVPATLSFFEVASLRVAAERVRSAVLGMEADDRKLPEQRVVILGAVEDGTSMYLPLTRQQYGLSAPKRCWTLSRSPLPYKLDRVGPKSITIRFGNGLSMLTTAPEQLLRTEREPLRLGQSVDVDGMRATVFELHDGRPSGVRFDFDVPLEDPSLYFVHPMYEGIVHFPIPAIGKSVNVPPPVIPMVAETRELPRPR